MSVHLMSAPLSARGAAARVSATRVVAMAASYIVIYGVTFAFFAPPATRMAAGEFSVVNSTTSTFVIILLAALMVTFGAAAYAASVGSRVEGEVAAGRITEQRAQLEFATYGLMIAGATVALYVGVISASGLATITPALVGGAAMALLIPGGVAALFTRAVVDHVAAAKRDLAGTVAGAIVVIVLTNYLIVGSLPSLADLPQIFGLG